MIDPGNTGATEIIGGILDRIATEDLFSVLEAFELHQQAEAIRRDLQTAPQPRVDTSASVGPYCFADTSVWQGLADVIQKRRATKLDIRASFLLGEPYDG